MEGLRCQNKQLVLYLEENGDLLKIFDLDDDMLEMGDWPRDCKRCIEERAHWALLLPRQDAESRK